MQPILTIPPTIPPHDRAPLQSVAAEVVASWPEGTFIENLAILDDGSIVVSVLSEARLDRIARGERQTLVQFDAPATGLVVIEGALYAAVGELGQGPIQIVRVEPSSARAEAVVTVSGAVFLNGLTRLQNRILVSTDSHQGRIYLIDLDGATSQIWCEDLRLTPSPEADFLPGANGIKRFGDYLYVSSNSRALLFRIPIRDSVAGALELVAQRLRVDDFAFDVQGNLYLTTHIGHTLDRLTLTGERTSIAGVQEGMAGSTACAFGRLPADRHRLYVTTTGGIYGPPDGRLEAAKLVRLDVGVEGAPL